MICANITELTGGALGAALLFVVAYGVGKLREFFLTRATSTIRDSFKLSKESLQRNRSIERYLYRLRDRYSASRVSVYQFHNGEVFLLADHSWKATCTHEVVGDGITHTIKEHQNLLVSQLTDWIDPIITGESVRTRGCEIVKVVDTAVIDDKHTTAERSLLLYEVAEMEPSSAKFTLQESGVGVLYCAPLRVPNKGKEKGGEVFGYLSLQFHGLHFTAQEELAKNNGLLMLRQFADDIQFLLHSAHIAGKSR